MLHIYVGVREYFNSPKLDPEFQRGIFLLLYTVMEGIAQLPNKKKRNKPAINFCHLVHNICL